MSTANYSLINKCGPALQDQCLMQCAFELSSCAILVYVFEQFFKKNKLKINISHFFEVEKGKKLESGYILCKIQDPDPD